GLDQHEISNGLSEHGSWGQDFCEQGTKQTVRKRAVMAEKQELEQSSQQMDFAHTRSRLDLLRRIRAESCVYLRAKTKESHPMRRNAILAVCVMVVLSAGAPTNVSARENGKPKPAAGDATLKEFLGRWDLTLRAPDKEYPSWLELREENGQLKAD